jgi:hypothetical protein
MFKPADITEALIETWIKAFEHWKYAIRFAWAQ